MRTNTLSLSVAALSTMIIMGAVTESSYAQNNLIVGSWAVSHGNFFRATWDFTPDGRYRYRQNDSSGSS